MVLILKSIPEEKKEKSSIISPETIILARLVNEQLSIFVKLKQNHFMTKLSQFFFFTKLRKVALTDGRNKSGIEGIFRKSE